MRMPPSPGGGAGVGVAAPRVTVPAPGVAIPAGPNAADAALVAVVALQNVGMGATECSSKNQYKEDINPGMKHGMALFEAAMKPVLSDQCIHITVTNAQKILNLLKDKASLYRWSCIISKIKVTAGDEMDLLTQYN
eukprot:12641481-Ditylum_brightwellii.AAC.2